MCHNQFWLDDKKTLNDMRNMKMSSVLFKKKLRQMFIIEIEIEIEIEIMIFSNTPYVWF